MLVPRARVASGTNNAGPGLTAPDAAVGISGVS